VICIAELGMLVLGIVLLVLKRLKVSRDTELGPGATRLLGFTLMLPLILGQGGGFVYGFTVGLKKGAQTKGRPMTQADIESLKKEIEQPALIINVAATAGSALFALFVVVAGTRSIPPPEPPAPEDAGRAYWDPGQFGEDEKEKGIRPGGP